MAISTETVVLKVEGDTTGAVRATQKLADAQRQLKRETSAVSAAMNQIPATKTAGLISTVGGAFKTAGIDTQTFSQGIKDIGKGLVFDQIRQQLKGLNNDLDSTAKSALAGATNGAAMGAAFGGPWGAAIGGAAGALLGLIRNTDRQTAASLRAAKAARTHAEALKLIQQGDTSARLERERRRHEMIVANAEVARANEIVAEHMRKAGHATEFALAVQLKARRAAEDAQDKYNALEKLGGDIWLEERTRVKERQRALEDLELARKNANVSTEVYEKRLAELNGTEARATDVTKERTKAIKAQTEARYANVRAALAGTNQRTDTAGAPIGFSTNLGAAADSTLRDLYGRDAEQGVLDRVNAERQQLLESERAAASARRASFLESSFGKLEEFNKYKIAFDGLTGAVTAGMDAWITGSESAGTAIKKFLGSYLGGLAAQMAIEALKYEAYAVASLVPGPFFNPAAAAGYATTGAMFAGGAAAAAVAARALGGGASTPSGGGGASSSFSGSGSAGGSGASAPAHTVTNYIIVGDTQADDSPRMKQRNFQRVVEIGTQRTSVGRSA